MLEQTLKTPLSSSRRTDAQDRVERPADRQTPSREKKAVKSTRAGKVIRIILTRSLRAVKGKSRKTPEQLPAGSQSVPFNPGRKQPHAAVDTADGGSPVLPTPAPAGGIGKMLVARGVIKSADLAKALKRKEEEPGKYLGQILSEMGFPQSRIMHEIYYSNKRKKLGEILVELNMITPGQLQETLNEQKHIKKQGVHVYLATLMIRNCIIGETHYLNALSAHFSMPVVSLENFILNLRLQKAIGERYALRNRIVVLSKSDCQLEIAIAEPHLSVFDHLEKAIPRGITISYCLARSAEIEKCFNQAYPFYF